MFRHFFNVVVRGGAGKDEPPSMDRFLEEADRQLENFQDLFRPAPVSKPRTPFDANLPREQVSMLNLTRQQRLKVMRQAAPLFLNMIRAARLYDGKLRPAKSEATPALIAELEARARAAGAKDIRYVRVPPNAIFCDKGIPHEYAIVFTVEMEKEPIDSAPGFECQLEVMRGYKNLAIISNNLASFLRDNGFAAYPGTALGGVTDYTYLAELAGLGAIGYHGLLLTPGEGARLRINTIYTNITNLPIATGNDHLWVRNFCAMCKKCIRQCPVDAIFAEPVPRGDGGMQTIDHASCRDYFTANYGCGVCLAVCPFSRVGYDTVKARFKGNDRAPQFRIPVEPIGVAQGTAHS
jgi:ferredoxin